MAKRTMREVRIFSGSAGVFAWLLIFCWLSAGCSKPASLPPPNSFAGMLAAVGIKMGKPYALPAGAKVTETDTPPLGDYPAYHVIQFKNANVSLDKNKKVQRVFFISPAYADPQYSSLTPLTLHTQDGKDLFELAYPDLEPLFGKPTYTGKDDPSLGNPFPLGCMYDFITKDKKMIEASIILSRPTNGRAGVTGIGVAYVNPAEQKAIQAKYKVPAWPG